MSNVFGGSNSDFLTEDEYNDREAIQQAQINTLQSNNNTNVLARVILLENEDITFNTRLTEAIDNITSIGIDVIDIKSDIDTIETSLNTKVSISAFNASQQIQDNNITNLQSADNIINTNINAINTSLNTKLNVSVYNANLATQTQLNTNLTTDLSNHNVRINQNSIAITATNINVSNLQTDVSNLQTDVSNLQTISNSKLNTSVYNANLITQTNKDTSQDLAISSLVSLNNTNTININNINTTLSNRVYPQPASITPSAAAITGTNVEAQLTTLKNAIDNIQVNASGLDPYVVTQLSFMANPVNGIRFFGGAGKWVNLNSVDQRLGMSASPSFASLNLTVTSGALTNNTFRCSGGNLNADIDTFRILRNGDIIGQTLDDPLNVNSIITTLRIINRGLDIRFRPESNINGVALNNILNPPPFANQLLNTTSDVQFKSLIVNAYSYFKSASTVANETVLQVRNFNDESKIELNNSGIIRCLNSNQQNGIILAPNAGLFVYNPNNLETAGTIKIDGSLQLNGSTRDNINTPSLNVDTSGNVVCKSLQTINNVNCNNLICNNIKPYLIDNLTINLSSNNTIQGTPNGCVFIGKNEMNKTITDYLDSNIIGSDNEFNDGIIKTTVIGNLNENINAFRSNVIGHNNFVSDLNDSNVFGNFNSCIANTRALLLGNQNVDLNESTIDSRNILIGFQNSAWGIKNTVLGFNNQFSGTDQESIPGRIFIGSNWGSGIELRDSANQVSGASIAIGDPGHIAHVHLGAGIPARSATSSIVPIFITTTIGSGGSGQARNCLVRDTSSRKYKENIIKKEYDIKTFMKLKTCQYNRIGSSKDETEIGLIAEEVQEIMPEFATIINGEVEGVDYARMVTMLIDIVQQQQKQINQFVLKFT